MLVAQSSSGTIAIRYASQIVDDVLFSYYKSNGGVLVPRQRRAQANAPAAWCWLRYVLDDVRHSG